MKTSEEIYLKKHIYILRGMGVGVGSEKSPGPFYTGEGKISFLRCVMPL